MADASSTTTLKKDLGLLDVYAVALAPTLSSGFFLLPGLAFGDAGPAVVLSYAIAALLVVPPIVSKVELSTAMPRSGGVYYFLDRSMGPLVGTIGGLGIWAVLILKSTFALVGMGAYLGLVWPNLPMLPVAGGLAIACGAINLYEAKKTGTFQILLVAGLLCILVWFSGAGIFQVRAARFADFFAAGFDTIFATAGLVYISFVGLTKVASVAEEVEDPERNLPLGVFLALGTTALIYVVGTIVMVGTTAPDRLAHDLTPVATAADSLAGPWGAYFITGGALLAFFATANAGILSASRYPLALSRDDLLPDWFGRLNTRKIPHLAVIVTVGIILFSLFVLDAKKIAKLASAFQLLTFGLLCLAVIVMRESQIESYDPGYKSPLYPWMQIIGFIAPLWIITKMGGLAILFSLGIVVAGALWYWYYGGHQVPREGAIYHVFARLARYRYEGLDQELRTIMKEKGPRESDPVDDVVASALVLDLDDVDSFEAVVARVSKELALHVPVRASELAEQFLEGRRIGVTPVTHGVALPHFRMDAINIPYMALVRVNKGVEVEEAEEPLYAFCFLISPEAEPTQHLRMLAHIAEQLDDPDFMRRWKEARDEQTLKELFLREERYLALTVTPDDGTAAWIDRPIRDIEFPPDSLVALIRREGNILVPHGHTVLQQGDRLTIIGKSDDIEALQEQLHAARAEETT